MKVPIMTGHLPARSWQFLSSAWLFIALSLVGGLIFDVHKYPMLISEGGIIESLSALGYFISVAAMFLGLCQWTYHLQKLYNRSRPAVGE